MNPHPHFATLARVFNHGTHHRGQINVTNLHQAHALLESGQSIGKITLPGF